MNLTSPVRARCQPDGAAPKPGRSSSEKPLEPAKSAADADAPGRKRRRLDASDFRDEGFYLAHERRVEEGEARTAAADAFLRVNAGERSRRGGSGGLDDAVMDLVEDERDGERKRQSVLKWDQRKKK